MAGRGTDIKLSPEVKAAGGLAIIGTERHESRRGPSVTWSQDVPATRVLLYSSYLWKMT